MPKRQRIIPRPSWNDPALPCIRAYKMWDGSKRTEADPDYERRYRQHQIETADHPGWRDDPTYELRRKK